MLHAYDSAGLAYQLGQHVREIAGARADVEDAGRRAGFGGGDEGEEFLDGGGVHVRGGNGGAVADGLGAVIVGGGGGVVCAVDLGVLIRVDGCDKERGNTLRKASLTEGVLIRPLRYRFSIRSRLEAPELRQAIVTISEREL